MLRYKLTLENMSSIEHKRPQESFEQHDTFTHRLELHNSNNEAIGEAELIYKNKPFPYYYLFFLKVQEAHRNEGFGKDLVKQLNTFLEAKGKSGILRNIIDENSPTVSIYENLGWTPLNGHSDWLIYNSPKNVSQEEVNKAIYSIKKTEDNGGFYVETNDTPPVKVAS